MIFFSFDNYAFLSDDSLMKVLNDNVGAMFTNSSAHTRFRCIEKPRHVRVTGLSSTLSEDDVTFLFYEHGAFVQEVKALRSAQSGTEFLVTFRKQSGRNPCLSIAS